MRALLFVPALLLLSACRSGNEQASATASTTTTTAHAHASVVRACPLGVPDTRITTTETSDRVIVAFATTPERAADLRGRIAHQAAMNGPDKHEGPGHEGMHGTAHGHGLRLWELPRLRTIVEETPDGARLHVMPLDPKELPELKTKLRERIRAIEDKDCP